MTPPFPRGETSPPGASGNCGGRFVAVTSLPPFQGIEVGAQGWQTACSVGTAPQSQELHHFRGQCLKNTEAFLEIEGQIAPHPDQLSPDLLSEDANPG